MLRHYFIYATCVLVLLLLQRSLGRLYHIRQCTTKINSWLDTCYETHPQSCKQPASSVLPKRLIFLGSNTNTERLVTVEQRRRRMPRYVALSYCWGREENFKTDSTNLRAMQRCIPRHKLPRTLQDVFAVVRRLGFQHLWVDALCILQDADGEEWETEAGKMGDAYANAALVLAATSSPSVHHGLFADRWRWWWWSWHHHSAAQKASFHHIMKTCRTMPQSAWTAAAGPIRRSHPLLCRGWAFQERLLARRVVHFTAVELVWECMADRWCGCGDEAQNGGLSGSINNLNSALRRCRVRPRPSHTRLMWRECVKSFSKRELTVLDDRLFAIAGIAAYVRGPEEAAYPQRYHHGLWEDALPWDLLWSCDQSSALQKVKARGPSYSWSSLDCGVEWPTCAHWGPDEKFSRAITTGTCFEFRRGDIADVAEVRICDVVSVGEDAMAVVSRMTPVELGSQESLRVRGAGHSQLWVVNSAEAKSGKMLPFFPDIFVGSDGLHDHGGYYYLEMAGFRDHSSTREIGLIVKKSQSDKSENHRLGYERVGIAGHISCDVRGTNVSWFTGEAMRKVILV